MNEAVNESSKLVAQARELLISCNIEWHNDDVAKAVILLDDALIKLTNAM